jgi:hypothetical protein
MAGEVWKLVGAHAAHGPFVMISWGYLIKADGTVVTWCPNPRLAPPAGTFISVSVGSTMACGVRTDGTIYCWPIS